MTQILLAGKSHMQSQKRILNHHLKFLIVNHYQKYLMLFYQTLKHYSDVTILIALVQIIILISMKFKN